MSTEMNRVLLQQPKRLFFGPGCAESAVAEFQAAGLKRILAITGRSGASLCPPLVESWQAAGIEVAVYDGISGEPDIAAFLRAVGFAKDFKPEGIVGFGGGSPLDVAKLVAALWDSDQAVMEVFGIGKLKRRSTFLACVPTTAGTGSEVSPNAILLDETDQLKKGAVSPYLVPDASFVDPLMTIGVPAAITAATGFDALVHCMEAYANKNAHPLVDVYALEGIRRIGSYLERAVRNGEDREARQNVMQGALFGGLCLAPVNTAAVHALAYPLGGTYHVSHGVSNSLLTPHVFRFNLQAAPDRYADIARALGVEGAGSHADIAELGVEHLTELSKTCGIPQRLRDLDVPEMAIETMAKAAMTVKRLLNNNPREMAVEDAERIYRAAW